ncbi:hypothetical protein JKA74_14270 [Marivirga sp. S37H4]|uniref:Uncharacterized protein n=1 Tax=Marivirga aurantiaca TaxID=2802615 RepID=A0A934X0E8_9BACT|nr:hypothetical protein [Marivirga aurantiaca]MBK6266207.1 hypothetical protein [Marivirga aurantiaca]
MEIGFIISSILLVAFAILATYDGLYLHLMKYRLPNYRQSKTEHITHTLRAILFPAILYFVFISSSPEYFYFGLLLVFIDIITVGIDAYSEENSRLWMGGLPRWEYILHLFVNGFHFATISVFLVLKIRLEAGSVVIVNGFEEVASYSAFSWLVINLIPGAIIVALLHLLLNFQKPRNSWNGLLDRFIKKPHSAKTMVKSR